MTCNCDNDGSNEYIIELNQQGAPGVKGDKGDTGYSPIVTYTTDGNGVQINIVNETTTEQTPVLPSKSYTDTQLAGKLNIDGSNASNPISFGNLTFSQLSGAINPKLSGNDDKVQIQSLVVKQGDSYSPTYLYATNNQGVCITNNTNTYLTVATNTLSFRNGTDTALELYGQYTSGTNQLKSTKDFYFNNQNAGKFYYGNGINYSEIATKADIPTVGNGTITFTQNGVTKGTFTANQSGNTTIALDSGVTNPLILNSNGEAGTGTIGIEAGTTGADNEIWVGQNTGGGALFRTLILLSDVADNITLTDNAFGTKKLSINTMTGCDSITGGASGLVPAPSAGDENKFLKADGTWDTVGGGGSSYTEGTGIDITNDTISVDESVVMTTGNQSTINFGYKRFDGITVTCGYGAGDGVRARKYDNSGSIQLISSDSSDRVGVGDLNAPIFILGSNDRPKYTGGSTLAGDLALYSDLPDVSDMATQTWVGNQGYLTSSDLSGYATETWVGQQGYALASSLATVATSGSYTDLLNRPTIPTNADYVDLTSNQSVAGNKTFTGTTYVRTTYICNASGTYFGRMRAVDDKFTFEAIGTNRSINLIPNGTGTLQYNGSEIAKKSDIPDVSQLQEKLTAGDGIECLFQ